jgi:hypothetical protein
MKRKNKESLVTDQPGRKIIFSGVILSFLIGFFIRGLTKPEILQAELKQVVSRIHSTTEINWGEVSISLKDGWWPRFSIIIRDVKAVSTESCWGQPLLYARELELPISLVSFFENGQPVKKIFVRDAFLELKTNFLCSKKSPRSAGSQEVAPARTIRLKPLKETPQAPPLVLTEFTFENLKVRHSEWIFPDWNFPLLELNVRENHPWFAELKSQIKISDLDGVDTGAELVAVYKEFPAQVLELKVKGNWREGTFNINGNWEGAQKGWSYQSRFNHIPFQFLKILANRTHTPWNWPDKPMWFSFSTQTVVPFTEWKSSQHFVRKLDVEGDLGELSISDFEIKSWNPFKVQPFTFFVQQADLNTVFEKELKKFSFLKSLGKLSGQGRWSSEKDVLFSGKIEQVQVPMSYREQKVTQIIKSLDIQAELKSGQWRMNSQKWNLEKGSATGNLKFESNQNLSTGQFNLNLINSNLNREALKLLDVSTPAVQVQGQLNAKWKKSVLTDFSSQFKTEELENGIFLFEKPIFVLKKNQESWDLKIQAPKIKLKDIAFMNLDPESMGRIQIPFESKSLNAFLQWDQNKSLKWNLKSSAIKSTGSLDPLGLLKGSLKLNNKSLQISGTSQKPQLLLLK